MKTRLLQYLFVWIVLSTLNPQLSTVFAQGTAFTYQGRLNDGVNTANGIYDLRFAIYDAATNGAAVGGVLTNTATAVTNGLFTVTLDFGAGVFNGSARWLEIAVQTNSGGTFATLTPRQALAAAPYAVMAGGASNLLGSLPAAQLSGTIANASLPASPAFSGTISAALFSGSGAGLTGLNADTLSSGTVPLERLPGAVVTNQAKGVTLAGAFAGAFTGDGAGLTNVPGARWQVVSGTNQQALANTGYIAANDATQAVFLLPVSPNVGDVIRVSGAGAGGWKIAQNSGQFISAGNLTAEIGAVWKLRNSGSRQWASIASSADGTRLIAADNGGFLYVSADAGATWAQRATSQNWSRVASSADGTKLVATAYGGPIYLSGNSGVNWGPSTAPVTNWMSVASSGDGAKLVAAANPGQIFVSTSSGATWAPSGSPATNWVSVVSSTDGSRLVASTSLGFLYTSADAGATWNPRMTDTVRRWMGLASSSDGVKLFAAAASSPVSNELYGSTDSGVTWFMYNSAQRWNTIACSVDGNRLIATVLAGPLYVSKDSGLTWTATATTQNWGAVASSADGSMLAAGVASGPIYTSQPSVPSTTVGDAGYLSGGQDTAIELQYFGNGRFAPVSHEGVISAY